MGMKRLDTEAAYCCSDCHDTLDLRKNLGRWSYDTLKLWHLEGVMRTQRILIEKGLLKID